MREIVEGLSNTLVVGDTIAAAHVCETSLQQVEPLMRISFGRLLAPFR